MNSVIQRIYKYFGQDGLLHIICSTLLVSILNIFLSILVSVLIVLLLGIGKEILWDKLLNKGTPDKKDIIADLIGIIIGII